MQQLSSTRFHGLDHLRTLAIVQVFLFHYFIISHGEPSWLPKVAAFGWSGVDLFFVLSGFLISSQLFEQVIRNKELSLRSYFAKRFFRILPAYWLVVALYFCLPFFREKEHLPPLWKFMTFTQNFGLNLATHGTFSHAWSLCVEEHFYLLLPFILLLFHKLQWPSWSKWLLPLLVLVGLVARYLSFQCGYMPSATEDGGAIMWYRHVYYPTWNRMDGLVAGVAIGAYRAFRPERWKIVASYGNKLLLTGISLLIFAMYLCSDQMTFAASIFGFPLVAAGYGLLVAGAASEASILYRYSSRITRTVAILSYSVYLVHKGVIHMTHVALERYVANNTIMLIVSLITTIAAAALLYTCVERPFMKMRTMFLQPFRGRVKRD